jgi:uncharacterized protein YcsI (UPF0317 family)
MSPKEVRLKARKGEINASTVNYCDGFVQCNLAILPRAYADDFARFCELNPKACPVVGVSAPGHWDLPAIGEDLDLRTDVPSYYVYRHGEFAGQVQTITDLWQDDFVAFAIGCSFSFDHVLREENIPLRHVEQNSTAGVYVTNIPNVPAGPFGGNLVVSMRPLKAADAIRAIEITSRYPRVHGSPVHIGDPSLIGIRDIGAIDYGDRVPVRDDELPVFWACGVTPHRAMLSARLPLAIAHTPGHMLVTDLPVASMLV